MNIFSTISTVGDIGANESYDERNRRLRREENIWNSAIDKVLEIVRHGEYVDIIRKLKK